MQSNSSLLKAGLQKRGEVASLQLVGSAKFSPFWHTAMLISQKVFSCSGVEMELLCQNLFALCSCCILAQLGGASFYQGVAGGPYCLQPTQAQTNHLQYDDDNRHMRKLCVPGSPPPTKSESESTHGRWGREGHTACIEGWRFLKKASIGRMQMTS